MKFRTAQPAAFEPVPEQDRIHLPGEFVDAPDAVLLDDLTCRIERKAIEAAHGINLAPVLTDILIPKSDMIGPVGTPASAVAPRMKVLARHQEFGDARDRLADPPCLVGCQFGHAKTVALRVITKIDPCERHAVGIPYLITLGIFPDERPRRVKTTA